MKIVIVGGGVIGFSCAVCTMKRFPEHEVVVVADQYSPNTTADKAGSIILPKTVGKDKEKTKKWFIDSYKYFQGIASSAEGNDTGVSLVYGYWATDLTEQDSWVREVIFGFRQVPEWECKLQRLPIDKTWWSLGTFIVNSTLYLRFLMSEFVSRGGRVEHRRLLTLDELFADHDIVVNCSGLGARTLASDLMVQPVWGQGKLVDAPWIKHFVIESNPISSTLPCTLAVNILPRNDGVYVGGAKMFGISDKSYDSAIAETISDHAQEIVPSLKHALILKEWTGVRPARDTVRLEIEEVRIATIPPSSSAHRKKYIVHNYGHSSHGVSLSWGCALESIELMQSIICKEVGKKHAKNS
jgi:glycine/D-amino acid oxidase-like deaminating enzyme